MQGSGGRSVPLKKRIKSALRWTVTHPPSRELLSPFARFFRYIWVCQHPGVAEGLFQPERVRLMDAIDTIYEERQLLLYRPEAFQLFTAVKRTAKIEGDLAEVGVFQGASAKIICEAKGDRQLFLCDTFEGLPELTKSDNRQEFYRGQYATDLRSVQEYLADYRNVTYCKGLFPDSADPAMRNSKFSFVNLDVDLYQGTRDCLEFFYPRMCRGGIILSHDYVHNSPGVRKAFDEFFETRPEPVLELCGTQALVVKL